MRLGELHIDAQMEASYSPPVLPATAAAAHAAALRSAVSSPVPSPAHAASAAWTASRLSTPAPSTHSSAYLAPPASSFVSPQPSSSSGMREIPPVSHTPQSAPPSLHRSGMFSATHTGGSSWSRAASPAHSAAASPIPRSASSAHMLQPCHCALSSSSMSACGLLPPASAFAAAAVPAAAAAPARVSVLLSSNPLQHYALTSSVDGAKAGRKLATMAEQGIAQALAQLVGKRRTFDLPDIPSLQHIKQSKKDREAASSAAADPRA